MDFADVFALVAPRIPVGPVTVRAFLAPAGARIGSLAANRGPQHLWLQTSGGDSLYR